MSAVVLPAASAAFTSTQVIFSNSTRSACARGTAHADPAASTREAVPPAINISKECETESITMSFSFPQRHKLVAVLRRADNYTNSLLSPDYSSVGARFCYSSGEHLRRRPCSMICAPSLEKRYYHCGAVGGCAKHADLAIGLRDVLDQPVDGVPSLGTQKR